MKLHGNSNTVFSRIALFFMAIAASSIFPVCSLSALPVAKSEFGTFDLPDLQTNPGGDISLEWRYANAVLGCEVWMLDDSPDAHARDRFAAEPGLLDVSLTEGGWPRSLPDRITVRVSPIYRRKSMATSMGKGCAEYENLTGIYVITWKGKTLPGPDGSSLFSVLDTTNDGDPKRGTRVLKAGDHRVIALVRDPSRGVSVSYRQPDPSDPIRDVKIWTPLSMGAGLDIDLGYYDEKRLGPGRLAAWSTEPGPGKPDPLWHPAYLEHLRQDPSGVLRFMTYLEINGVEPGVTGKTEWRDRKSPSTTLGCLVGISPSNWERHPATRLHGGTQVPYEWIMDLCGLVGKDAWLQVPHTASDGYIAELAALAAASLPAGRRVWFEFSNELWNNYGPYAAQYAAAAAEGRRFGKDQSWGSGHLQAHAIQVFENAWMKAGRRDDELVNVLSGFALSADYNAGVLKGAKALAPEIPEVVAITTYFGANLTEELFSLPYGSGSPGADVYAQAAEIIRKDIYRDFEAWKETAGLCRSNGLCMVAYEGGSHLLATGHGDWNVPRHAAFMIFLANLHRQPVIGDLYLEHWALWKAAGGRTASLFTDIGSYGYYGFWGAKEDVTQRFETSPRYRAAKAFVSISAGIRPIDDPKGSRPEFAKRDSLRAEVGLPVSLGVAVSGGDGQLSSNVMAGCLPPGLMASSNDEGGLMLAGVPETAGKYRFVARVTDGDGDPDYAVIEVDVDPRGSSGGRLLLVDPSGLPAGRLERSENNEEYRTRYDIDSRRPLIRDMISGEPRMLIPFDGYKPLFVAHYNDEALTLSPSSPYAPSGGFSLTLLVKDLFRENAQLERELGSQGLTPQNTNSLIWVGFRNRRFAGTVGSSLDLPADASHPQERRFGVPTRFDALVVWRRDQMEAASGTVLSFGPGEDQASIVLETEGCGADEVTWRFIIRTKDQKGTTSYYISEAAWHETAAARLVLSDFNANAEPGKRWALFNPEPAAFEMPPAGSLEFLPVDFRMVDGVGLAMQSRRFGWHYGFGFSRFLVIGARTK